MTVALYAHMDLPSEAARLEKLVSSGATIAHHADADGFFAAYFARRLGGRSGEVINITTDGLDLADLSALIPETHSDDIVLFDINVLSHPAAMETLSAAVTAATVFDDHIGEARDVPPNVTTVELLPPEDAHYPGIRPASLFCYALLEARGENTALDDLLVNAAAIGEGVAHAFAGQLPGASKQDRRLAKRIGWGVNAYFTSSQVPRINDDLLIQLEALPVGSQAAQSIRGSSFFATADQASEVVSDLVSRWAGECDLNRPWLEAGGKPVFRVDVEADYRVVNLVSSELRTRANRGVAIATQPTPGGLAVELRRARSLHSPDLAAVLLRLPADYVVSRGGHPMACGATFKHQTAVDAMEALRRELAAALATSD